MSCRFNCGLFIGLLLPVESVGKNHFMAVGPPRRVVSCRWTVVSLSLITDRRQLAMQLDGDLCRTECRYVEPRDQGIGAEPRLLPLGEAAGILFYLCDCGGAVGIAAQIGDYLLVPQTAKRGERGRAALRQ